MTRPTPRVPGLVTALAVSLAVTGAATGLAALSDGRQQVLGALLGGALVSGFYLFGTCSTALAAAFAPALSLFVALLTYTLQVAGLALVLARLGGPGVGRPGPDLRWAAGTVIAGTLAWTVALVVGAVREVRSSTARGTRGEALSGPTEPPPGAPGPETRG